MAGNRGCQLGREARVEGPQEGCSSRRDLPDTAASVTAEEKGQAGPWAPGSHCLWADPASGAQPHRRCAGRKPSLTPGQGLQMPPLGPCRALDALLPPSSHRTERVRAQPVWITLSSGLPGDLSSTAHLPCLPRTHVRVHVCIPKETCRPSCTCTPHTRVHTDAAGICTRTCQQHWAWLTPFLEQGFLTFSVPQAPFQNKGFIYLFI